MANFIFEKNGSIRTTSFNASGAQDIGTINFYIDSSLLTNQSQIFLIMQNEDGLYEIIELAKDGATSSAILYKVPLNQEIRINDEKAHLSLLILNGKNNTYQISKNKILTHIITNNYRIARQIYIAREVGVQVQNALTKIMALTDNMERG